MLPHVPGGDPASSHRRRRRPSRTVAAARPDPEAPTPPPVVPAPREERVVHLPAAVIDRLSVVHLQAAWAQMVETHARVGRTPFYDATVASIGIDPVRRSS